jgi:hypothetical protein
MNTPARSQEFAAKRRPSQVLSSARIRFPSTSSGRVGCRWSGILCGCRSVPRGGESLQLELHTRPSRARELGRLLRTHIGVRRTPHCNARPSTRPSSAQSFLVPSTARLNTIFSRLTILEVGEKLTDFDYTDRGNILFLV